MRQIIRKNKTEIKAFLTGRMPHFVTRRTAPEFFDKVPVFTFHDVEPLEFEAQLHFLVENGYRALDADELTSAVRRGTRCEKEIALTFDDGTWTFWTYAYPLLKKYGLKAILFAVPGVVSKAPDVFPSLNDVWQGKCGMEVLEERFKIQPLCTWRELRVMHESSIVDVQSHSLTHSLVPIGAQLIDFINPRFKLYAGGLNVPISSNVDPSLLKERVRFGSPVFKYASRLAGHLHFRENPQLRETLTGYVAKRGGRSFFESAAWKKELMTVFRRWPRGKVGAFETQAEMETEMRCEFVESKKLIEARLPGKTVRHFCYPWSEGSRLADRLAAETGYVSLHYGVLTPERMDANPLDILMLQRLGEEYLFRLPGNGRKSLLSALLGKAGKPDRSKRPAALGSAGVPGRYTPKLANSVVHNPQQT